MNETNSHLLAAARAYVTDIFQHKVKPEFVFHSLEHTEDVVEACSRLADHYQLPEEDRLTLLLAAWFHDAGYSAGQAEGHEEISAQMATQFLASHQVEESMAQRVASCIRATRMPQSPVSLIEKILCDADLYHLSTKDFKARNSLLKQERESFLGQKINKKDWRKGNIHFLEGHQYFTDFGKDRLEPKKQENLALLYKKKKVVEEEPKEPETPFPYKMEEDKRDKQAQKNAERGIQTMFRTTSNNHIELSSMADNKANLLITVNSIILSAGLAYLMPRIAGGEDDFLLPSIVLMLTCLVTITLAILATRPSINKGKFTEEDIRSKKTNLLFFGNFHQMSLQEYQWAISQMLRDKEYLYNTMAMDIYFLGVVLARKYKLLRIAYTVFMIGIILVVIASVLSITIFADSVATNTRPVIDYR